MTDHYKDTLTRGDTSLGLFPNAIKSDEELHVCWWNRGDTRQRAEELAITIDGAKYTACTEGASDYRA
ncbi:MAG: hypothetical protein ACFNLH_10920, partial [Corynebacterium matruchotii]